MRFLKNNDDLTIIVALNIVLFFLIFLLDIAILRVIIATPFILFVPGYSFLAVVFTRKTDLGWSERIALGFPMSIAMASAIGLMLNLTPWGFALVPMFISLSAFVLAMGVAAFKLRTRLPENERLNIDFINQLLIKMKKGIDRLSMSVSNQSHAPISKPSLTKLKRAILFDRALNIFLGIAVFSAAGSVFYAIAIPREGEKYSEFYILGPNGKAADYPHNIASGDNVTVTLAIVNHELSPTSYNFTVTDNGTGIARQGEIRLANEETWQQPVSVIPDKNGDSQKIEFLLFKNSEIEPYLRLHLWVNVK